MELSDLFSAKVRFIRAEGKDIKAEEIEKLFPPLSLFISVMDGAEVPDKESLLKSLASVLRFPAYFGYNWDALLDCMRSLPDFTGAKNHILIIKNSNLFLKDSQGALAVFRETVEEAADFLEENYKGFLKVVLS